MAFDMRTRDYNVFLVRGINIIYMKIKIDTYSTTLGAVSYFTYASVLGLKMFKS
jgi:hypothetical protein